MAAKRITVHAIEIEDKPGSLQKLLAMAAEEGIDFQCFTACSCGGKGMAYLSAKDPSKCDACAAKAGMAPTEMAGFLISGDDKVGAAADALKPLAEAGINGVAGSAMVCDGSFGLLVIVNAADGDAAEKALAG